jgi:hypothetical protein
MSNRLEKFSIFTAHIFSQLYDSFPVPVNLDKRSAVASIFDFDVLDERQRKLSTVKGIKKMTEELVVSDNPHLKEDQREKFKKNLEDPKVEVRIKSLEDEITELESSAKELNYIFEGTLTFLETEKYIRQEDYKWQLTEKGFSHLNKKFSDNDIMDVQGSLISRFKEQLTDPSKIGAQTLMQITAGTFTNILS